MDLKQLRKKRKLTQNEVAVLTGTTSQYISMIERGERIPSDEMKFKLSKIYQAKLEDIFLICWRTQSSEK